MLGRSRGEIIRSGRTSEKARCCCGMGWRMQLWAGSRGHKPSFALCGEPVAPPGHLQGAAPDFRRGVSVIKYKLVFIFTWFHVLAVSLGGRDFIIIKNMFLFRYISTTYYSLIYFLTLPRGLYCCTSRSLTSNIFNLLSY